MRGFYFSFLMMLLMLYTAAKAQPVRTIQQEMNGIEAYNTARMPEKVFIHTDKWNYNKEDTIWFKAYVFDATLIATARSGLMYIEIVDASNRVASRNMVSLSNGVGWGYIALKADRYPEGTYTLRAYTNWMLNFGQRDMFSRQFTIEGELDDENWMINSRFELSEKEGLNNVKTNLSFKKNDGKLMLLEDLQVRILDRLWTLHRTKLNTGIDGKLDFDFDLPAKTKISNVNIELTKKTKRGPNVTYNVPVILNRDEKTDLQFMPEGGNMVAGVSGRVGFKSINEEGNGVDVSGGVYNSKGQKIAAINTTHRGMGSFELKPEANEKYSARVNYKGKQLIFALPEAKSSGIVMRVDNTTSKDSILITVSAFDEVKQTGDSYYLIGQARNVVCFGAMVNIAKQNKNYAVHRSAFPTGVARFTLLSQSNQPVAERTVFVDHHDQIRLSIKSSKQSYSNRDSVNLEISATDKDGAPVQGSFSLAVTDDLQTRIDTSGYNDIPAKTLLVDDLKGNIENPGWYFAKRDTLKKAEALDALMLTQGWVNYDWKEVFTEKQKQQAYKPEAEFVVKGKVTNVFNKSLEKSDVFLMGTNPTVLLQTETDENGNFAFTGIEPPDTAIYHVQAKNKRGRAFNVAIKMEEYTPPQLVTTYQRQVPTYVDMDTTRLTNMRVKAQYDAEVEKLPGTRLKEVTIKAKKIVKGSRSLVGPGEADVTINAEDSEGMGKVNLGDLFKKIPGFSRAKGYLSIGIAHTGIIVDGALEFYPYSKVGRYSGLSLDNFFKYVEIDDIKGLEVMTAGKNVIPYIERFIPDYTGPISDVSFIEVTTYAGKGVNIKIPGAEIYRPPSFALKKEFYSPLYKVKKPNIGVDTRATIFWAPNVVTDEKGKATIGFYTADKTATYTVNVQGADMEGMVGAAQSKIKVKPDK
jgi:hypothetical protein